MNLHELLSSPWVGRLGWTLLHSLWEIAAVAGLLGIVLALLRRGSPQVRYLAAGVAMGAMLVATAATFLAVGSPTFPPPSPVQPAPAPVALIQQPMPTPTPPAVEHVSPSAPPVPDTGVEARAPLAPAVATVQPWPERCRQALEPSLPWLVGAWVAGVLALSFWRAGGWVAAYRLRVVGTRPVGADIEAMIRRLAGRLGLRRPIRVVQSLLVQTPMVIGWLRPVILLPLAAVAGLTPAQLEAIFAHELAHIRRFDYLVNLLQAAVEVLFFYHPAVWWVSRRMRIERERCCDDVAVAVCGNRIGYVEALAAVEEVRRPAVEPAVARTSGPVVAAGGTGGTDLIDRVRRVLGLPAPAASVVARSGAPALAIVATLAIAIGLHVSARGGDAALTATKPVTQPEADYRGGRLPPGALARLGTTQYRKGPDGFMGRLQFNADASVVRAGLWAWEVRTGQLQAALPLPKEDQYVRLLAFSRDGQLALHTGRSGARYATADTNGLVLSLREAQTGKVVRQLEGGAGRGWPVGTTFSPDGRYVAVIDGSVGGWDWYGFGVWEVGTGRKVVAGTPVAGNHALVGGVDFAPDGTLLVLAEGDGVIRVYDVPGGKLARRCQTTAQQLQALCFIDQQTVCAGASDGLYVWKLDQPSPAHWKGNAQVVRQVVVSPDRRFLAAATRKGLLVFELATGKPLLAPDETPFANDVLSLAFSGDGRVLALSREQCVEFLEVGTWTPMYPVESHAVTIHALAVSDDGRLIATGDEHGMIRLWDGQGKPLQTLQAGRQVLQLALAPDGRTLASRVGLWDITSGKLRVPYDSDPSGLLSFVNHGRAVLEVGRFAITWRDAASGQVTKTIKPGQFCVFLRASLSADGRTFVWSETDQRFGRDGRAPSPRLYTAHVYDMKAGKEIASYPVGSHALALSPDGQRLAVGEDSDYRQPSPARLAVTIRNAATGSVQHRIIFERGFPSLLEWSPDGRLLAAEYRDNTIRVYSTADFSQVGQFTGHADYIQRMRWFPDGRKLVSIGHDTTGLIWDVGSLKALSAPASGPAIAAPATQARGG